MFRDPHINKVLRVWILLLFFSTGVLAQTDADKGIIDLSEIDFQTQKAVELNGEWEFYWLEILSPQELHDLDNRDTSFVKFPHLWNEDPNLSSYGFATYALTIIIPENTPALGLTIPDMYTAYRLYINGTELTSNGTVAKSREDYTPFWLPRTISINSFNSDTLDLVLNISNFRHSKGGIRLPVIIGDYEHLQKQRTLRLGFSLLLTGCLFMIGLFFLGLYLFGRHEIPMLYFAFVCFFFSYRILGTELYPLHYLFPNLPWLLTVKAEYFSLYFTPALFCIFVQRLYPDETSKQIIYSLAGIFGVFSASAILLSPYYFTKTVDLFFLIIPLFIVYITWVYIKAVKNKREGAKFALASVVLVFIVFLHNLLEYYTILKENLLLNFIGFFSFFFLQSLILSYRFTNSLTKSRIKAEEAANAKSQFLSTMSHEIRTPLNAVIGLSELIVKSDSDQDKNDFATSIKQSGEHLLEIINNILDFSKFESIGIEKEEETVNIRNLLREIIDLLSPLSSDKNLSFDLEINEAIPEWIISDSTHLKQILINLIGNAIKFTAKGSISVSVDLNRDLSRKGDYRFSVIDTGPGISDDSVHRLFKSFSQIDSSRTRRHGGTGLGLAISKRLVEALNGEIWFESKLGEGTTFYFTIESKATSVIQPEEHYKKLHTELEASKISGLKILIAEDNLMNQKVIQRMLQKFDLKSDIVINGKEVLEKLSTQPYDLILMDMEMPVMDGLESTEKIRSSLPESEQPIIIAITANAFQEDREKCLKAGMNDFIAKPVSMDAISAMLKKWFH